MRYLLMLYTKESDWAAMAEADRGSLYKEYMEFTESIRTSGQYIGGNPLQPTTTATTVRVRDGKSGITDGPFAETREQLGGYYLIEAADLDEAVSIASRIPAARLGAVEVRPIMAIP